jgi:hypothetical protein
MCPLLLLHLFPPFFLIAVVFVIVFVLVVLLFSFSSSSMLSSFSSSQNWHNPRCRRWCHPHHWRHSCSSWQRPSDKVGGVGSPCAYFIDAYLIDAMARSLAPFYCWDCQDNMLEDRILWSQADRCPHKGGRTHRASRRDTHHHEAVLGRVQSWLLKVDGSKQPRLRPSLW